MQVTANSQAWLQLDSAHVIGRGHVLPRFEVALVARTLRESVRVRVMELQADMVLDNERIGSGGVRQTGTVINFVETPLTLEVPTDHRVLAYVQNQFRGHTLNLRLEWRGLLQVREEGSE